MGKWSGSVPAVRQGKPLSDVEGGTLGGALNEAMVPEPGGPGDTRSSVAPVKGSDSARFPEVGTAATATPAGLAPTVMVSWTVSVAVSTTVTVFEPESVT